MYTIRVNKVGRLEEGGLYSREAAAIRSEDDADVLTDGEWRISDLPPGVIMERPQFLGAYQRKSLFFLDPTSQTVVPDLRWISGGQDQVAAPADRPDDRRTEGSVGAGCTKRTRQWRVGDRSDHQGRRQAGTGRSRSRRCAHQLPSGQPDGCCDARFVCSASHLDARQCRCRGAVRSGDRRRTAGRGSCGRLDHRRRRVHQPAGHHECDRRTARTAQRFTGERQRAGGDSGARFRGQCGQPHGGCSLAGRQVGRSRRRHRLGRIQPPGSTCRSVHTAMVPLRCSKAAPSPDLRGSWTTTRSGRR